MCSADLPYATIEVEITYVPSELDADQEATVVLEHAALGAYEYVCAGRGARPSLMAEHRPAALVGDPQSYMFNFRNPFDVPIDVDVQLEEDAVYPGALRLIMKRPALRLAPRQQTSIPLAFDPRVIAEHHAVVSIGADVRGERLVWRYPVRGMVNAPVQLRAVRFGCKAKTSQRREIRLRLQNLAGLEAGGPHRFPVVPHRDDFVALLLSSSVGRVRTSNGRPVRSNDASDVREDSPRGEVTRRKGQARPKIGRAHV